MVGLQAVLRLDRLGALAVAHFRWSWLAAPLGGRFDVFRAALPACLVTVIAIGWWVALWQPGAAAPLPWVPLLNPLALAQWAALALFALRVRASPSAASTQRALVAVLSAAAFALVTAMTLRTVHHWGGVPWTAHSMMPSSLAHTSLTVVWSVLGVAAWIAGSRRRQRALWLGGAALMAVVLAKLVLVDRQHLGNLLGIGSFIAYGLLCSVIGYIAPAPPRQASGAAPAEP